MGFRCLAEPNLQWTPLDGETTSGTHSRSRSGASKEGRYPELVGPRARSRLVVFEVEVGGRWSEESQNFISQLVRARARGEQPILRRRAEQVWRIRWGSLVSCVVARAVALHCWGLPRALGHPSAPRVGVTCLRRVLWCDAGAPFFRLTVVN